MSQYLNTPPPPPPMPPAQGYYVPPQRHGLALPSLIIGLIGILFFLVAPLGLLFGIIAMIGVKNSRGLKTGFGMALAGTLCSLFGLAVAAIVLSSGPPKDRVASGQKITPDADLDVAEINIMTDANGVAYSNSAAGYDLAEAFSALFKSAALMSTDDLDEDSEFITHCQLHDGSVAFVTHVPKLRTFDDDSKAAICDMAWQVAHVVLRQAGVDPGSELAVGVRGNLLYESIYSGTYKEVAEEAEVPGPDEQGKQEDVLEAFFKGVELEAEEAAPAAAGSIE